MKMKLMPFAGLKTVVAILMTLGFSVIQSSGLSINDGSYVGKVVDGTPASVTDEANYINYLITVSLGGTGTATNGTLGNGGNQNEVHTFTRSSNNFGALPNAIVSTASKIDTTVSVTFDITNWTYVYGKFGANGYLWYVGNQTGNVTLPTQLLGPSTGISHYVLFNPSKPNGEPNGVPDGGATALLLGVALVGVGIFRMRLA